MKSSALPKRRGDDRAAWCYASGRVSALETVLLPRSFFQALLECRSVDEVRSTLGKTPYRTLFAAQDSVADYDAAISGRLDAAARELLGQCPPHVMGRYFELPKLCESARKLFLRRADQGAPGEELAGILASPAAGDFERASISMHAQLARERRFVGDSVAASLLLDGAVRTLAVALADEAREEPVRTVLLDRALLSAWASVLRYRWNGTPADSICRWFRLGRDMDGFVEATAAAAEAQPAAVLAGRVSRGAARAITAVSPGGLRAEIDAAVHAACRDGVLSCRRRAFGAERVLSYLFALEVERMNLRISVAAVLNNLDRREALSALRSEYV